MQDPYRVLGVSPNASEDEIKKVNEAYSTIMKMRREGTSGSSQSHQGYGGYGNSSYGNSNPYGNYGGYGNYGNYGNYGGYGGYGGRSQGGYTQSSPRMQAVRATASPRSIMLGRRSAWIPTISSIARFSAVWRAAAISTKPTARNTASTFRPPFVAIPAQSVV